MKNYKIFFALFLALLFLAFGKERALSEHGKAVYLVNVEGIIDLGLAPFIKRVIKEAEKNKAEAVILKINTFGGRLDAAVQIRDALIDSKIKTIAYIDKRAISAGALISLACNIIVMSEASTVGAATPVEIGPTETKPTSEKVVSYFRSEMKSTAEKNHRPSNLAEAMVDPDVEIPGLDPKGKLLTLTTESAIKYKFADFVSNSVNEILAKLQYEGSEIITFKINWAEQIVRWITQPVVSSLLMTIGFLALLLEFKAPGFGFPGILGILSLSLFFFGHYIVNLAGLEEILLFVVGLALTLAEIFVIPGFGIVGILGILAIITSLTLSLMDAKIPFSFETISSAITRVGISIIITFAGILTMLKFLPSSPIGKRLILSQEQTNTDSNSIDLQIGIEGITHTQLRPSGIAIINGKRCDVITDGEFLDAGTKIIVTHIEGAKIIVEKKA
jgi:membrane-bound serine protease (ClpP class)